MSLEAKAFERKKTWRRWSQMCTKRKQEHRFWRTVRISCFFMSLLRLGNRVVSKDLPRSRIIYNKYYYNRTFHSGGSSFLFRDPSFALSPHPPPRSPAPVVRTPKLLFFCLFTNEVITGGDREKSAAPRRGKVGILDTTSGHLKCKMQDRGESQTNGKVTILIRPLDT